MSLVTASERLLGHRGDCFTLVDPTGLANLLALANQSVCPSCHRQQTFKIPGTKVLFCTDPYHALRARLGVSP